MSLSNILFGIEIETCYHNIDRTDNKIFDINKKYKQSIIDNQKFLYTCFNKKSQYMEKENLKWIFCHPTDKKCSDYTKWMVTSDATLYCHPTNLAEPEYTIDYKKKTTDLPPLNFYPVEFVSPILNIKELNNILLIFHGWLLDSKLIYTVNDTQGLHVNLSYNLDTNVNYKNNFAKLWYIFEPVVLNMITENRRDINEEWEIQSKLKFSEIDYKLNTNIFNSKNTNLKIHSDRLELRVFDGTMDVDEILNNVRFSILLLSASITIQKSEIARLSKIHDIELLILEMFDLIKDINIIKFCIQRLIRNKKNNVKIPNIDLGIYKKILPITQLSQFDMITAMHAFSFSC